MGKKERFYMEVVIVIDICVMVLLAISVGEDLLKQTDYWPRPDNPDYFE